MRRTKNQLTKVNTTLSYWHILYSANSFFCQMKMGMVSLHVSPLWTFDQVIYLTSKQKNMNKMTPRKMCVFIWCRQAKPSQTRPCQICWFTLNHLCIRDRINHCRIHSERWNTKRKVAHGIGSQAATDIFVFVSCACQITSRSFD